MNDDDCVIMDDSYFEKDDVSEAESSVVEETDMSPEMKDKIWVWRKNMKQYYNVLTADNIGSEPQFGATASLSFRGTVQARAHRDDPHAVSILSIYAGTTHSAANTPPDEDGTVTIPNNYLVLYDDLRLPGRPDAADLGGAAAPNGLEIRESSALSYGDFGSGPEFGVDATAGKQFRRARWLVQSGPTLAVAAAPHSLNVVAARVGPATRNDSGSYLYRDGGAVVFDISQHPSQPADGASFTCQASLLPPLLLAGSASGPSQVAPAGTAESSTVRPMSGVGAGVAWNSDIPGIIAATFAAAPGAVAVYDSTKDGSATAAVDTPPSKAKDGATSVGTSAAYTSRIIPPSGRSDRARVVQPFAVWAAPADVRPHVGVLPAPGAPAGASGATPGASASTAAAATAPTVSAVGAPSGAVCADGTPAMYCDVARECVWTSRSTLLVGMADRFAFYDTRCPQRAALLGAAGGGGPLVSVCPSMRSLFATTTAQNTSVVALYDARAPSTPIVNLTRGAAAPAATGSAFTYSGTRAAVTALAWHPVVPHMLASGHVGGEVVLWDISQRAAQHIPTVAGLYAGDKSANVDPPVISDDYGGAMAPSGARARPGVRVAFVHHGHTEAVSAVTWHPTPDALVASATVDGDVHVYRPADEFVGRCPAEALPSSVVEAADAAVMAGAVTRATAAPVDEPPVRAAAPAATAQAAAPRAMSVDADDGIRVLEGAEAADASGAADAADASRLNQAQALLASAAADAIGVALRAAAAAVPSGTSAALSELAAAYEAAGAPARAVGAVM